MARQRVPVSLIGGYLGTGKTTLLNRILAQDHGLRLAVLLNDFGAINIDAELVTGKTDNLISLANGCICCGIGDDLGEAVLDTLALSPLPDHIVIEASGIAEPARVRGILSMLPGLRIGATIVLASARSLPRQVGDPQIGPLVRKQLAAADLILLNKVDLGSRAEIESGRRWLDDHMPGITVVETVRATVPQDLLFDTPVRPQGDATEAMHSHGPDFATVTFESDRPLWRDGFRRLLEDPPGGIVRAKGFLRFADRPQEICVLQQTGRHWTIETAGGSAPATNTTRLVFIGLAPGFDGASLQERLQGISDRG